MGEPENKYQQLLNLLGDFPESPPLHVTILEEVAIQGGVRYKIEYLVESADPLFDEPEDYIRSYLFVPVHEPGTKLPAIIAIHQDANNMHLGKIEPAGLDTSDDQHQYYPDQQYGLELYQRGYVVLCPDRFGHGERRRLLDGDTEIDSQRDGSLYNHRSGQLLMKGRTSAGKEVYDLMRSADVLCSLDYVDTAKLGAIGHSAGGYMMVYFMFVDSRIKVGVSSCGFFELLNFFNDREPVKRWASTAIPGLARIGRSADYLAYVAPRPVLLTRGRSEWSGHADGERRSLEHVRQTEDIVTHAQQRYKALNAGEHLHTIYFDGWHVFADEPKSEAYAWLDHQLVDSRNGA